MSQIANTPQLPYYTVIFTSVRTELDDDYAQTAARMLELAAEQEGFLGVESARDGLGITLSYWRDLDAIHRWKQQSEHLDAQRRGRSDWYAQYRVRIARVERDYSFDAQPVAAQPHQPG